MTCIMIVEDDVHLCEMYAEFLREQHYEVVPFDSASQTFDWLIQKRSTPDVVILDMNLANESGLMVLALIRRLPRLHHTKVIIASGYPEIAHNAIEQWGADHFLLKPVGLHDLITVIGNLMSQPTP